ncbi:MAG: rRNA adenine N(6)-methyltransferase family protein [Planctomycetes bacterium]|nr:rRNA adenine N(6)-methyltransferase family protein [Planctomycetota bacterium]
MAELRRRGFRPKRRLGQCFLFDSQYLRAAVDDAALEPGEPIVEIGCGAGTLTAELLRRGCEVLGAEIDPLLCAYLRERFETPRFVLFEGDVLASKNRLAPGFVELLSRWQGSFRLVANLPYAVATPAVVLLVSMPPPPHLSGFAVLVQAEQAERWLARPGTPAFGPASVWLQSCGEGAIARPAHRDLFTPRPQVDSVFCTWRRGLRDDEPAVELLSVVRQLFQSRRKMLRGIVGAAIGAEDPWWRERGIDPRSRPAELTPAQHRTLAAELARRGWVG